VPILFRKGEGNIVTAVRGEVDDERGGVVGT
jgi:hypothetical protein